MHTVADNTMWYGLELIVSIAAALLSSIPVARFFGPEKLSYFTFLQWLTNVGALLAMIGIPAMTRKYMAEYMGRNEPAVVWAVFTTGLRMQSYMALVIVAIGGVLTAFYVRPDHQLIAVIMLVTVVFRLLICVPSNANNAAEKMRTNFFGGLLGSVTTVLLVNFSLIAGWGLVGIAAGFLIATIFELTLKMILTLKWLPRVPGAKPPPELLRRMRRFSGQELVLMAVNIVVWDRSDILFLQWLDKDPRQITFFALAFNLVEKVLLLPIAFTTVIGNSVMAQSGRNKEKYYEVAAIAPKYAFLVSLPVMFGMAALSGPIMQLLYGVEYSPAIPVLAIAAMMAAAKPLLPPVQSLMQAEERQAFLIQWALLSGGIKIVLDLILIPISGAQGAAWANGLAQAFAIAGVWTAATRGYHLAIPSRSILKIMLSSVVMAAIVWMAVQVKLHVSLKIVSGVSLGAVVYLLMIAATGALSSVDVGRLRYLLQRLPIPARKPASYVLRMLAFRHSGAAA